MAGEEEGTAGEAESEEGKEGKEEEEKKGPPNIEDALARARETFEAKGTMMADVEEEVDGEKEDEGGEEDEEEEAGEEEGGEAGADDEEVEEGEGADADDEDDVGEGEKEGEEDESKKPITVKVPGRQPDDEDIEIEVEDQELAERISHLKSGFMRGEEVRKRTVELDASEGAMEELSDSFEVDPAAFVMKYTDEENLPAVVLALLTESSVWEALKPQIAKLTTNPNELRLAQAEAKATRMEAAQKLTTRISQRKENAESGAKLRDAIDLMVPETMTEKVREQLIADLTRDTSDHITRNKLVKLDVKDLVPILAARLESSGIDPLEARKAVQNGSRSQAKISTKKGPKKKAKTGQELARASAKRKKVAAAPGPGKKAAPTQPTKLPAGQNIEERIAAARKHGIAALVPGE